VNVAHSIQEVSTQASLYIPISDPPIKLPSYVTLDPRSQWHNSAVLSVALESMTLPSRLKPVDGKHCTLNEFEAALNTNGNQKIAKLQCSIVDPETSQRRLASSGEPTTRDQRLPTSRQHVPNTTDRLDEDGTDTPNAGLPALDMDLLPGEDQSYGNNVKRAHVIGHAETFRGEQEQSEPQEEDDDGFARKRRRIAGLPIVEKLVCSRFLLRRCTIMIIALSAHAL